jgi:hypothetical protein
MRALWALAGSILVLCGGCCTHCADKKSTTQTAAVVGIAAAPAAAPVRAAAPAQAPAMAAASAAGNWKWSVDAGGNTIDQSANFTQSGETLTGTFTDGFDGATFPIKDGKLSKDGQISFTVNRTLEGFGDFTLNFAGKLEGNSIKGEVKFGTADQPMSAPWEAKR